MGHCGPHRVVSMFARGLHDADSIAYDAASSGRRLAGNVRPGFMCSKSSLNANQLMPYNFTYCNFAAAFPLGFDRL